MVTVSGATARNDGPDGRAAVGEYTPQSRDPLLIPTPSAKWLRIVTLPPDTLKSGRLSVNPLNCAVTCAPSFVPSDPCPAKCSPPASRVACETVNPRYGLWSGGWYRNGLVSDSAPEIQRPWSASNVMVPDAEDVSPAVTPGNLTVAARAT